MTVREQAELIGTIAMLPEFGLVYEWAVQVEIIDFRPAFGRIDVLIKPIAGSGKRWVSYDRLIFPKAKVQA